MHCDIRAENVQPKVLRPAIPRQVLGFNERVGLDILSLPHWSDATRSVKCLVVTRSCRLMFWFLEQMWLAVTMPVLDRHSERAVQIRQAARKVFVESQDDKAMRRALVARPRFWRDFKVGDQVAFWRKGRGRRMRSGHARWHGRTIVLALYPLSKNVWITYRHQLLKVSQEQLRMATVTERVADDVIHQELRAIGEKQRGRRSRVCRNIWTSREIHYRHRLTSSHKRVRRKEWSDVIASKIAARDLLHRQVLFNPKILKIQRLLRNWC